MICPSPTIDKRSTLQRQMRQEPDRNSITQVSLGFIMDNVTELLTWSQNTNVIFEYFEDPVYFPFDGSQTPVDGNLQIKVFPITFTLCIPYVRIRLY